MLHIVTHSLYKAHAFLSSGSVLDAAASLKNDNGRISPGRRSLLMLPVAVSMALTICTATVRGLTADHLSKPGAVVLSLILTIALTQLLWPSFSSGSIRLAGWGVLAAMAVSAGYSAAYLLTDRALALSVSHQKVMPSLFDSMVTGFVGLGFIGIFLLQTATRLPNQGRLMKSLYVHAVHGFYLDVPARRITAWVWGHRGPAQ